MTAPEHPYEQNPQHGIQYENVQECGHETERPITIVEPARPAAHSPCWTPVLNRTYRVSNSKTANKQNQRYWYR